MHCSYLLCLLLIRFTRKQYKAKTSWSSKLQKEGIVGFLGLHNCHTGSCSGCFQWVLGIFSISHLFLFVFLLVSQSFLSLWKLSHVFFFFATAKEVFSLDCLCLHGAYKLVKLLGFFLQSIRLLKVRERKRRCWFLLAFIHVELFILENSVKIIMQWVAFYQRGPIWQILICLGFVVGVP